MSDAINKISPERSTVCSAHGLRYDSRTATGCVRCQQEKAAAARGTRDRKVHTALLTLLLLGLTAGVAIWRGPAVRDAITWMRNLTTASKQVERAASTAQSTHFSKIDPEPLRAKIETLEGMLYGANTFWAISGNHLALAVGELSEEISAGPSQALIRAALQRYTEMHSIEEEGGYVGVNIESARDEWEKIRNRSFQTAA